MANKVLLPVKGSDVKASGPFSGGGTCWEKTQQCLVSIPHMKVSKVQLMPCEAPAFRNTDVSFLMAENVGSKDLGHRKGTKGPEGVVAGASSGVVLGGALGWLIGIGALTIPGFGALLAAGPVVAALAGAGAAGTAGGFIGGLIGIGIPEYEAKRYQGRVRNGGNLSVSPLRQSGVDETRERDSGPDGCAGHLFYRRSQRRLCAHRQTDPADRRHR